MSTEEKVFHAFGKMVLGMIEDVITATVQTQIEGGYGRWNIVTRDGASIDIIIATPKAADLMERILSAQTLEMVTVPGTVPGVH